MRILRYKSQGQAVHLLEEVLVKLGYKIVVSNYFGLDTLRAVKDFQLKNNLIVDGLVGPKTWSKIIEKEQQLALFNDKFLSEQDLIDFANNNHLELATVKAVNEVESRGKGFLIDGRPVILFEGHVFWRELDKRGLDPNTLLTDRYKDILYKKWTKKFYKGGSGEYTRLEKAAGMSDDPRVHDAAYAAASWGAFQIMGFHYKKLGYATVDHFVSEMYEHESEHLKAFGKFITINKFNGKPLIDWLKEKNWAKFANGYNGAGYKQNKYDIKLQKAYEKYND